ncbi:Energy-coupling factor transporter ATP-binding protein EcfA1 [bioreactor metagenome]|uniref:Energy-coupling factor transporter ATP-binding protein EcfA1 n=1 Tax=bioreactor metagenome TaxID=1076179 RepID=A0A644TMP0_9ZZZZ|nr:energy-coupling factor transporter ATPase [Negativicutes bacterium]
MGDFIQIENLCHAFKTPEGGEFLALDHINLTINKGEFVAIIGTNGSGKSTLARHLNALLLPTSGKCMIKGLDTIDINNLWQIRQTVGMVFQNPDNQIVAAVVEEDVAFGPENLGIEPSEICRRVETVLASVGMTEYRYHAPHLLSGGQKQRVGIAGALAMHPECLVLDEPTAMLDPVGRKEVLATVCQLNKQDQMTIVYITHFMEEAAAADWVVVVDQGKVVLTGTPDEVFSKTEQLKAMGLDVPLASDLAYRLKERGLDLPDGIVHDDELAVALCR